MFFPVPAHRWMRLTLLAAVCLLVATTSSAQSWWNAAWKRRIQLTFDNSAQGSNLGNVPVLVVLTPSRVSYSDLQASGQDLRFIDDDGVTVLDHEIESWNPAGNSYIWVRVGQIDASSTIDHIWMYYRNGAAPDAQNAAGVWSNGYVGVWHLKEDPSGAGPQMMDSTGNLNDGTSGGTMTSGDQVPGQIAGSLDFDGIDDLVDVGSAAALDDLGPLTASAWIFPRTAGGGGSGKILAKYVNPTLGRWMLELDNTAPEVDTFEFVRDYDTTALSQAPVNSSTSYSAWQLVTATWDGGAASAGVRIYKNQTELVYTTSVDGVTSPTADASHPLVIGNRGDGGVPFDGLIDEVRISNVVRSPDWVAAQHLSTTDAYITYGAPAGFTYYRSIGTRADYTTGTLTATNASAVVTGAGTLWLSANRGRGDRVDIGGVDYTVLSVDSETQLTLTQPFSGSYSGGYTISRQFTGATALQDWEDCIDNTTLCPYFPVASSSLVADDRSEVGVVYNDSTFTAGVNLRGALTDGAHTIALTADSGNRHHGVPGSGALISGAAGNVVDVEVDFATVEWIEVNGGSRGVEINNAGASNRIVVRNNLVLNTTAQGIRVQRANVIAEIYNNVVINSTAGIEFRDAAQGDVFNNTVYSCSSSGLRGNPTNGPYPTVTLRNNIAHSNGVDFDFDPGGGPTMNAASSNNLASDGTGIAHSPAGGGIDSVALAAMQFVNAPGGDLHIQPTSAAEDVAADLSGTFAFDVDGGLRSTPWDIGADDIAATTEVELSDLMATAGNASVEIRWRTASELDNLGFHVYRATDPGGLYRRVTSRLIPGLGSSPEGATYRYVDSGLENGRTYYYELEDVEATGRAERHGPVSATPTARGVVSKSPESEPAAALEYGSPEQSELRVLARGARGVLLELTTAGFRADVGESGAIRLEVPGLDEASESGNLALPVKRSTLDAIAGRKVEIATVRALDVRTFASLGPELEGGGELVGSRKGTVKRARRRRRASGDAAAPWARLVTVGFQGERKKALVELSPFRFESDGSLTLAKRLLVHVVFAGIEPSERTSATNRGRRVVWTRGGERVAARFVTREPGLYGVRFEDAFGRWHRGFAEMRLSRQGEDVSYHVEPQGRHYGPGSTLYFVSEGARLNPYGNEAVFELEVGVAGPRMEVEDATPSGTPIGFYRHVESYEENHLYQAGLVEAPDRWLWDLLFAPVTKSYAFAVSREASVGETSRLKVWLQGTSNDPGHEDHHVRLSVNGFHAAESRWDGKRAVLVEAELPPGTLRDGENTLEIESVADTGAAYSMVMLDRFEIDYPRESVADGRLQGQWSELGTAEVAELGTRPLWVRRSAGLSWLTGLTSNADGTVRFAVRPGSDYLGASQALKPDVRRPRATALKRSWNQADYLILGPREYLREASPLLQLRRRQGLRARAVALEDVYEAFGHGEETPEAIRAFLSHAYHVWRKPTVRYVVLLGDGTYDYKDYLGTGVANRVPPLLVRTPYLWTASDPAYAAVNGEDPLPEFAIGRLPAASVAEVRVLVAKMLAYESRHERSPGMVLVADDADDAGNFEANAEELSAGVLSGYPVEKLYLSRLGREATRARIAEAFDAGTSLMSYMGHGGIHLWADENVLDGSDVSRLSTQPEQPILLTMNCLNGYFHFPYFDSLSEALLKADARGAIAAISPSGLSEDRAAHRYHLALLTELLNGGHERLGDALLRAQERYVDSGGAPDLLEIYHLLGDPALSLR